MGRRRSGGDPIGPVALAPGPPRLRRALVVLAGLYLGIVALSNTPLSLSDRLPETPRFFVRASCLFPQAGVASIDYRVEGWSCGEARYRELDYRPYFPLRTEDKESRFHRIGRFYRKDPTVMQALDRYLVNRHNRGAAGPGGAGDGIDGPIGGIRHVSLRLPLPAPGEPVERYRRRPLTEIAPEHRKDWFSTGEQNRQRRCEEAGAGPAPPSATTEDLDE
jgi:hypothetical protein